LCFFYVLCHFPKHLFIFSVSRVNEEDRIQASENVSSHKVSEDEESRDDTDDDDDADDYDYTPDICMFNMWKDGCLYKANCHNVHCARPFLWQYKGPQASWINFDDESNKEIEFNFTDPHNESCLSTTGKFPRYINSFDLLKESPTIYPSLSIMM